ncbi:MAG: RpiB/LacA/LacB family sugar-phosphate isomerase, partial [Bacillota bacterium]|nr:RpiB/LacA/LacB family sugar-phosphate isomerase [Bacillota bacterium]
YGQKVGKSVASGQADRGIVICGSGIGISIAANKVKGIRAALCSEELSARLCREHNDANVLAMGARLIGETMALSIVDVFLTTEFQGGRHQQRVDMLEALDKGE